MSQNYIELIHKWATRDALTVTKGEHTRGRQAEIRMSMIKGIRKMPQSEKRRLYYQYCGILNNKIAAIDGGKSSGTIPAFID